MIKYLRNLCLLTGVDNGGVDGVHGEDKQHIDNALDESGGMVLEIMVKKMVELKGYHIIC